MKRITNNRGTVTIVRFTFALLMVFSFSAPEEESRAEEAVVTVDASKDLGRLRRHELYNNNSAWRTPGADSENPKPSDGGFAAVV